MSSYNLIKDNCRLVKGSNSKLNIFCGFCGKQLHSSLSFDWEEWNNDVLNMFNIVEGKITYHLLFKCNKKKSLI